ncbi:hypothetical protein [Nocardia gipuzkoensis]
MNTILEAIIVIVVALLAMPTVFVAAGVAAGKKDGVRALVHQAARPVLVLFCCAVSICILLLVILPVGVVFFGAGIFLF